ncbi:hypothetical protein LTR84_009016 [Exophiala bonariae]|uniref:Heterokaryon incompatibility domain-containing protein n=1 Tax=Exophiala bonariae TaxID=1690606 RepID=A0AAV9MW41_9EURO|nr:hypothetical protein LTR84_009016 [Exophiala bonariae]
MRLLNIQSLKLEEFFEPDVPAYAILSHRWGEGEITLSDMETRTYKSKKAYFKLEFARKQAEDDCLQYIWIDTCCIDKSSSSELSEAINSMFRWFQEAEVCYAFMSDVLIEPQDEDDIFKSFAESAWFTRGWTLQELIAPEKVHFYNASWSYIGSRYSLCSEITRITKINTKVLRARQKPLEQLLSACTVAQRMSWAAHRKTTRIEDRAYSLMGIFAVNMPLLYGEGKRAFTRLQEEILKVGSDLSVFAWQQCRSERTNQRELFAASPDNFETCTDVVHSPQLNQPTGDDVTLTMTNVGLRIDRPLVASVRQDVPTRRGDLLLSLECRYARDVTRIIALKLEPSGPPSMFIPHPHQNSDEQQSLCHVGGQIDELRLRTIDLLRPIRSSSRWPFLTIAREFVPARLSHQAAATMHTHVWVDLPDKTIPKALREQYQWEYLSCHPERYWNLRNLTFNLDDAISDTIGVEPPPTSGGSRWVGGALALSIPWTSCRIVIFFGQRFTTMDARENILFKILPYNPDTFPHLDEAFVWTDVVDRVLDIPPAHQAVVRLSNLRRPGILIAQLSVATQLKVVDHGCEQPFELDSASGAALNTDPAQRRIFMDSESSRNDFVPLPWLAESYIPFCEVKN